MCLLALIPFPFLTFSAVVGYVVVLAALWVTLATGFTGHYFLTALYLLLAVVFNPIVPVIHEAALLRGADIVGAALLFYAAARLKPDAIGVQSPIDLEDRVEEQKTSPPR